MEPFNPGWFSIELPGYRECGGTYCLFPYESLPPVDRDLFVDEFHWLTPLADMVEEEIQIHRPVQDGVTLNLNKLVAASEALDLNLPVAFLVLMGNGHLRKRVPSCTACYFDLPEEITPSPFAEGGYFIRFLNDQQDVLLWYLYVNHEGESCVVVSPLDLAEEFASMETPLDELKEHLFFCAPSFEEFIYRFWLENTIWFAVDEGRALTEAERRYVEHYTE